MKIRNRYHLLLAAGLTLALAGCNGHAETGEAEGAPDVAPVERRDLEIRAEASGQIEPVRVVEVKSKVSGELTRITVETGDEVEQGALIASVDPRDVRTAHFSVQPRFDEGRHDSDEEGSPPHIVGYVVQNRLEIRLRDLRSAETLISRLFDAGANSGGGPSFTLSDDLAGAFGRAAGAA